MFYVGLDVSVARTGGVHHGRRGPGGPRAVRGEHAGGDQAAVRASGREIERVGLEAGISSAWIARGLLEAGLPVIVIDATHAAAALKTGFRNKTDKNDARGIAART